MRNFPIDYHLIVLAFVVLAWVWRLVVRFIRWSGRQIKGGAAGATSAQMVPPPSQAPPPPQAPPTRPPALTAARPMPRQPQAGGPAVPREATERDFRRQEEELIAWEPAALGIALQSSAPTAVPLKALFGSSDDLVRAIILREALGPPLSRRRSPGAPPPTPSP